MTPGIRVQGLACSYGNGPVLEDISLTVRQGDFFMVLGPNGSGKTTLLKAIAGIVKPQQGELSILGRPVQDYSRKELARVLGLVQQLAPVDFPFTVQEVVLMGRAPHLGLLGIEKQEDLALAQEAMIFTGVAHLAKRRLDRLSGGECQRVFIARAICQTPRIILLDEPTASLDLAHQIKVMDLLYRLREEKGVTVVMVSHDLNIAAMYGNDLVLLKNGRIVRQGPPETVLAAEALHQAYGCKVLVDQSPVGRFPRVTLVPGRPM